MARIYSELHQNIQDRCAVAGIEILSPAYTSVRDGNPSTIPGACRRIPTTELLSPTLLQRAPSAIECNK